VNTGRDAAATGPPLAPAPGPAYRVNRSAPAGLPPEDPATMTTPMTTIETTEIELVGEARAALLGHLSGDAEARFIRIHVGRG